MQPDERSKRYEDLLELPHPVSKHHSPMPMTARAAQFVPYSALTGYYDLLREADNRTREDLADQERGIPMELAELLETGEENM